VEEGCELKIPQRLETTLIIFCVAVVLLLTSILGVVIQERVRKARRQRQVNQLVVVS